jgi:hypothetical protein
MKELVVFISMLLMQALFRYINKKSTTSVAEDNIHVMPMAYLVIGYLMILLSGVILVLPQLLSNPPEYYHPIVWIIIVLIFLFGVWIIELYKVHFVSTSADSFIIHSMFGKVKEFKYDQISSVDLNYFTYFVIVRDQNNRKGKIYFHLKGLLKVLRKINSKSGKDISDIERLLTFF